MTVAERLLFFFFCTVAQDRLERIQTHPKSPTVLDPARKLIFFLQNDSVEKREVQPGVQSLVG